MKSIEKTIRPDVVMSFNEWVMYIRNQLKKGEENVTKTENGKRINKPN